MIKEFVVEMKGVYGGVRDVSIVEKWFIVIVILIVKGNFDVFIFLDDDYVDYLEYYLVFFLVYDCEVIIIVFCC